VSYARALGFLLIVFPWKSQILRAAGTLTDQPAGMHQLPRLRLTASPGWATHLSGGGSSVDDQVGSYDEACFG
jgi:hypothetical protein